MRALQPRIPQRALLAAREVGREEQAVRSRNAIAPHAGRCSPSFQPNSAAQPAISRAGRQQIHFAAVPGVLTCGVSRYRAAGSSRASRSRREYGARAEADRNHALVESRHRVGGADGVRGAAADRDARRQAEQRRAGCDQGAGRGIRGRSLRQQTRAGKLQNSHRSSAKRRSLQIVDAVAGGGGRLGQAQPGQRVTADNPWPRERSAPRRSGRRSETATWERDSGRRWACRCAHTCCAALRS